MKTLTSMKSVEGNIQGFILSIVGVGIVLAVGLIVVAQLAQTQVTSNLGPDCGQNATGGSAGIAYTNCGAAYNASVAINSQLATVPNWIGIIITVALAFIVLGYFYNRM